MSAIDDSWEEVKKVIKNLQEDRDAFLEQNRALKEGMDLIEKSIVRQNERQHRLEAERDRYKEALKTIEGLNHSGHYIEGEPGGHENKGCLASDLAQSALAQMEGK